MTALVLAACTSSVPGGQASSPASVSTAVASTTSPPAGTGSPPTTSLSTGDLSDPEVRRVQVGDRPLVVAWADSPGERARGLMGVRDLGDLEGMLFDLGSERPVSFTMRNTLIPIDIYFFDTDGAAVGMLEMVPCEAEPCPSYSIAAPARYALEVPAGTVDPGPGATLVVP